ncbi:unnamed protein product [Linum tenue]|uniref:Cytochrome P450 n=1 Tax=Linum tenue TaxID=586396 RepID=A0AAV0NA73_9ROSI|nr:unnamed protein product [Linum tenue]
MVLSLLLLLPVSVITILVIITLPRLLANPALSPKKPLPPGPKPWPIVGNLPHLGKMPHLSFQHFSNLYGPLISFRLGSQHLVVADSPAAAAEILRIHDRILSARFISRVFPYTATELDRKAVIWASSCNSQWKDFRAMFRNQIFSNKAIESQSALREKKVAEMVEFLGGKLGESVSIEEVAFSSIFDSLSNLIFSRDCIGFERNETKNRLRSLIQRLIELGVAPNLADFFPILKNLDLQGLTREASRTLNQIYSIFAPYVKERREKRRNRDGAEAGDFLDIFLENGIDDDQINWLTLELYVAGTDTTAMTIEWAMTELVRNRGAMNKLREELKREVLFPPLPGEPLINESVAAQLPYLNAVVKETMRLHPVGALLLPHRAAESCEVMNYMIPAGAQVLVNVWAIGRDPTIWGDDSASFRPERFIGSKVDFRGQDFELLPFGSGRRMCPGVSLAARQVPLVLAALVRRFDWCLPSGEDPIEMNMREKFGLLLQKEQPLLLVPSQSSL